MADAGIATAPGTQASVPIAAADFFPRLFVGDSPYQRKDSLQRAEVFFGTPIETGDFIQGIALCLEWLFDQDMPSSKRKLKITSDRRAKKDLKDLNVDTGLYFARRYRGLRALFGPRVTWDYGELLNFEALSELWCWTTSNTSDSE